MGGQTASTARWTLAQKGAGTIGVEMIGASKEAIDKAEDRELFDEAMKRLVLNCADKLAHTMEEAWVLRMTSAFPAIIRPSLPWAVRWRHRL